MDVFVSKNMEYVGDMANVDIDIPSQFYHSKALYVVVFLLLVLLHIYPI